MEKRDSSSAEEGFQCKRVVGEITTDEKEGRDMVSGLPPHLQQDTGVTTKVWKERWRKDFCWLVLRIR